MSLLSSQEMQNKNPRKDSRMETTEIRGKTRPATSKNVPDLSSNDVEEVDKGRHYSLMGQSGGRRRRGIDDWLVGDRYDGERWVQSGWLVRNQERKGKVT